MKHAELELGATIEGGVFITDTTLLISQAFVGKQREIFFKKVLEKDCEEDEI